MPFYIYENWQKPPKSDHHIDPQIAETYDLREKALNRCIALTQESLASAKAKGSSEAIRPLQLAVSRKNYRLAYVGMQ
jgi:hypothetical protein